MARKPDAAVPLSVPADQLPLDAATRRAAVVAERLAGRSETDIAQRLGLPLLTVRRILAQALAEANARHAADADALRAVELERLDRLWLALWDRALAGELAAVDRLLRIVDRRARLLGLDVRNVQLVVDESATRRLVEVIVRHVKDPQALAAIREELRRLAAPPVDAAYQPLPPGDA